MRLLLDHCVPLSFAGMLLGHEVEHTSRLFWGHLSNERLLNAAENAGFEGLVTFDDCIRHEKVFEARDVCVICLRSPRRDVETLKSLAGLVMTALPRVRPKNILLVRHPNWRD